MNDSRKQGNWLGQIWREHSNLVLVLLCSILLLQDIFGAHGLMAMRQSQREAARIRQEIKILDAENQQAEQRIHALQTDPSVIECIARARGLARPGENVFLLQGGPGGAPDDLDDSCFSSLKPEGGASPAQTTPQGVAPPAGDH